MIHCYPWTLWVNVLQFQSSCNMSKKNKQAPLPKCQPDKNFSPYAVTSKARLPSKVLNGIQRDDRASFTLFLVCLSWEPQTTFLQSWGLADLSHTLRERERETEREKPRERSRKRNSVETHLSVKVTYATVYKRSKASLRCSQRIYSGTEREYDHHSSVEMMDFDLKCR